MSKPTIDEQIDAVKGCHVDRTTTVEGRDEAVEAALRTLEFVRDHQEEIRYAVARKKALAAAQSDPAIQRVFEVFPEAQIEGVGEAE